jgi:hypothetical protein
MFISNDVVAAAIFADRASGCIDEGVLVLRLNDALNDEVAVG